MSYHTGRSGGMRRTQRGTRTQRGARQRTMGRTQTNTYQRGTMTTQGQSTNNNPIIEKFNASRSPRYYRPDGRAVTIGAPLHRHADGTVMTEHTMDNDTSVIVTTTPGGSKTSPKRIQRSTSSNRRRRRRIKPSRIQSQVRQYNYAGTQKSYLGKVVMVGGIPYSTKSGALEGNSVALELRTSNRPFNMRKSKRRQF